MENLSVTDCVKSLNGLLETQVVSVEGEVHEFAINQGKFVFFKLKDEQSSVECFLFAWQLKVPVEDGMMVRVLATPGLYQKTGRFRLLIERIEPIGEGALRRALALLRQRLSSEGLFEVSRKRSVPRYPERLGLIASRESAAYSDFLKVLKHRYGGLEIIFTHVAVQGTEASRQIVEAFQRLSHLQPPLDAIVITRGGGSLEDLQAFNTEEVARAIFACSVPVVSAVGHERDITIADEVADVRASTPSNAAELLVPDRLALQRQLTSSHQHLQRTVKHRLSNDAASVQQQSARLVNIFARLRLRIEISITKFGSIARSFQEHQLVVMNQINGFAQDLQRSWNERQELFSRKLKSQESLLEAVNPGRVLARGFSIVRQAGRVVKSSKRLTVGALIDVTLADGTIESKVTGHH